MINNQCCPFGEIINRKERILHKTNNFIATPTIGPMEIEGYLLVCSKDHYISLGEIPQKLCYELENLLNKTKKIINDNYSKEIVIFEHGPKFSSCKGGACVDHMHLHVVPTKVDLLDFLKKNFEIKKIDNFEPLREICRKAKSSYLFIENQRRERYLCEIKDALPSQYIRQIIAAGEKKKNWDWREYPDIKTFNKTFEKLKNKF